MSIILVDAAGRPLTAEWKRGDGTVTRVEDGVARPPDPQRYTVDILEVATGEVVRREMALPWGEGSLYWWTDGNYGCDCNRSMEFHRGKGWNEEEIWADDTGYCRGSGKYRVTITLPSGEVPLREFL